MLHSCIQLYVLPVVLNHREDQRHGYLTVSELRGMSASTSVCSHHQTTCQNKVSLHAESIDE